MFIFSNLLLSVAMVLSMVLKLYMWLIIARALLSWVNPDPRNPIVRFLYSATEPLLYRVRKLVPAFGGGIDFSPFNSALLTRPIPAHDSRDFESCVAAAPLRRAAASARRRS